MASQNIRGLVNELVEQKLLLTHTAFVGRAYAVRGSRADVQPLTLAKEALGSAKPQPVLVDVPRLRGLELAEGDVVLCVVCERDISHAMRGQLAMPARRRHDLADAVIVGVMEP